VTGKRSVKTDKLAINLLFQGNKMSFERDSSPANIEQLAVKTHKFFVQFEAAFGSDFARILA
jgi:hypothetical protein